MKKLLVSMLSLMMMFSLLPNAIVLADEPTNDTSSIKVEEQNEAEKVVEQSPSPDSSPTVVPSAEPVKTASATATTEATSTPTSEPTATATPTPVATPTSSAVSTTAPEDKVTSVQKKIDELPTVDEIKPLDQSKQAEINEKAQTISDEIDDLSEENQEKLDITKLQSIFEYFDSLTNLTTEGDNNENSLLNSVAKIGENGYSSVTTAIEAVTDSAIINVIANTTEDITIPAGKTITLDIASGVTITNSSSHTITNNGNLTITGSGTIDNVTHQKGALYNNVGAVAVLDGGTYTRSKEAGKDADNSGENSWYTIKNFGTMIINKSVVVNQGADGNGKFSSLVANGWQNWKDKGTNGEPTSDSPAKLTINGGTFSGGLNVIKNDDNGELEINGGNIIGYAQHAVLNWHKLTINGGTFTTNEKKCVATIANYNSNVSYNLGELTITEGEFSGSNALFLVNAGAKTKILGGTFASDVSEYLADGYVCSKEGAVFKVVDAITTDNTSVSNIKSYKNATSFNAESITPTISKLDDESVTEKFNKSDAKTELDTIVKKISTEKIIPFEVEMVAKDSNGDTTTISELNNDATFHVNLNESTLESLKNKTFRLYRIHETENNGTEIEKIDATLNGNTLTFSSNKFSWYVLVVENDTVKIDLSEMTGSLTISPTGYSQNGGDEIEFTGKYILTGTIKRDTPLVFKNPTTEEVAYDVTLDNAHLIAETWCTVIAFRDSSSNITLNITNKGTSEIVSSSHPVFSNQTGGNGVEKIDVSVNIIQTEGSSLKLDRSYKDDNPNIVFNDETNVKIDGTEISSTSAYKSGDYAPKTISPSSETYTINQGGEYIIMGGNYTAANNAIDIDTTEDVTIYVDSATKVTTTSPNFINIKQKCNVTIKGVNESNGFTIENTSSSDDSNLIFMKAVDATVNVNKGTFITNGNGIQGYLNSTYYGTVKLRNCSLTNSQGLVNDAVGIKAKNVTINNSKVQGFTYGLMSNSIDNWVVNSSFKDCENAIYVTETGTCMLRERLSFEGNQSDILLAKDATFIPYDDFETNELIKVSVESLSDITESNPTRLITREGSSVTKEMASKFTTTDSKFAIKYDSDSGSLYYWYHTHNWDYSWNSETSNVITAKCSDEDCYYHSNAATLTLNAEDMDYTGEAYDKAKLINQIPNISVENIKYLTKDAIVLESAPTNAGSYKVSAKIIGTNFWAVVKEFKINKIDPTVDVKPITNLTYNGDEQELVKGSTNGGTLKYQVNDGDWTTELPTAKNAGTYTIKYKVDGGDNYNDVETKSIEVKISEKTISVSGITASNKEYDGNTTATVDCSKAVLDGLVEGDELTVNATGAFDSKDAGERKVTISDLTLGGKDVKNYVLDTESSQKETTATITPKPITATIASNGGTYGEKIEGATAILNGLVTGEEPTVTLTYTGKANDGTEYNSTEVPTNAGAYTVIATITDGNYDLEKSEAKFLVERANANLSVTAVLDKTYGDKSFGLEASYDGDGAVSYTSSNKNVATVDKTGKVTINGVGSTTFTVKVAESNNYKEDSASISIKVKKSEHELVIDTLTYEKTYGDKPFSLGVSAKDSESKITYKSSDEKVASVDGNGLVTIHNAGKTDITVSMNESDNYKAVSKKISIVVNQKDISKATVTLGDTLSYTGKEQTQSIKSVVVDGLNVDSYTISDNKATNPGTYTLKITGKGNFTGSVSTSYTVVPTKSEQFKEDADGKLTIGKGTVSVIGTSNLVTSKAELVEMLIQSGDITTEELQKIYEGSNVDIVLSVQDVSHTLSDDIKKAMKDASSKSGLTIGNQYVDISLYKDGTAIHTTSNKLKITLSVPNEMINTDKNVNRTYYVVRYHDGEVTNIDGTFDEKAKTFTFETDKFSAYALAYKDTKVETAEKQETKKAADTSDQSNVALYTGLALVAMLGVVLLIQRRKLEK